MAPPKTAIEADRLRGPDAAGLRAGGGAGFRRLPPLLPRARTPSPTRRRARYKFAFAYGVSQSGRFMRTFLLYGLNTAPAGKAFDGLLANGGGQDTSTCSDRNSDPGSGGTFSAETVHAPYSWSEVMARSGTDAKVFALNAESEYFEMMAYMTRRGPAPENVRVYEFPLGGHGGGGTVPWDVCVRPLSVALEQWASDGTKPPDSRMFILERRESPRAKHLPSEPAELPATDDLGIARGGVRLPPVEVPLVRYVCRRRQGAQGHTVGQGRAGPPLRHARKLPQEGVGDGRSAYPGPVLARIGADEVRRGRREGQLVRIARPALDELGPAGCLAPLEMTP